MGLCSLSQVGFCCSNGFGFTIIALACILISCVIVVYVHVALPIMYPRHLYPAAHWTSLVVMAWISFNVVFNYLRALSVAPNRIPRERWNDIVQGQVQRRVEAGCPSAVAQRQVVKCPSCAGFRLPRTRHCYMCGQCVQKMDHHCPWINNCVGHENQRYFFLFLLYLLIGTTYCGLHITYIKGVMGVFGGFTFGLSGGLGLFSSGASKTSKALDSLHYAHVAEVAPNEHWRHFSQAQVTAMDSTIVFFVQVLCLMIWIAMLGFVGWCGYLLVTNQTAMEFPGNKAEKARFDRAYGVSSQNRSSSFIVSCILSLPASGVSKYRSPYDLGRLHNVLQVFATKGDKCTNYFLTTGSHEQPRGLLKLWLVLWAITPSIEPLAMDGSEWPRWDGSDDVLTRMMSSRFDSFV